MSVRSVSAFRALSLSAAVAGVLAGLRPANAVTYDWDVGATPNDNAVTGGTGTWDVATANFTGNGGASNAPWVNSATDVARFGTPGGTVTLSTLIVAGGLTFTSNGYTLQNNGTAANALNLGGGMAVDVGTGMTATITATLGGGADNTIYFTKTGDGSLVLNPLTSGTAGPNTFLGDVRITNGSVVAQTGNAFAGGATANGTRIILDQESGKTATVQVNTGYDPAQSPAGSFDRYLFGPGGGTINVAGTATTQQQLTLNDAGQFGDYTGATAATVFTKAGQGLVLLQTQAYTFSGSVVVNEGTLRVDGAGNLGAATNTNPVTVNSGGTFDLRATLNHAAKAFTIAGPGWNNAGALVAGANTVSVGAVTMSASASLGGAGQLTVGSIGESAAGSSLTKVGTGLTILNATNTYTGNTVVAGGTLRDTTNTSLPNSAGTLLGNLNLAGGAYERNGTFNLALGTGANQVQFGAGTSGLSAFGAALTVNVGGAAAELAWGVGQFNPGTLVLNGASANNALTLQNPLDLNAGTANVNRTISVGANTTTIGTLIRDSSATNTAGLTKTGAGTLVLSNAANTYDGGTTINGGTLSVATLPDGATSPIGSGNIAFTTGTGSGTFQYTGATAITTARTFTVGANNATIDVTNAAGGLEIPSSVGGNNANTVTKAGAGTLTLSGTGDNGSFILNAAGGTTLLNKSGAATSRAVAGISGLAAGATVRLVGTGTDQIYGGNLSASTAAAGLANLSGGTLDFNAKNESLDRLGGYGSVTNNGAAGTTSVMTVGESSSVANYAGNINDGPAGGKMAVVKVGTGTQTLAGGGTYSGGTTVNAGVLRASTNTALGTGPVTLNGGTLQLAGSKISGFGGTGTGFTLNGGPTIAGDVLVLTTNTGSLARSVYNNTRVDARGFTASFRYDNGTDGGGADGFVFTLQNQSLTALGGSGGSRGFSGITPSVGVTFNIFGNDNTAVGVNGALSGTTNGQLATADTVPATLLNLADVTVNYDGTTLTFTVTNPNDATQTITRSTAINLPAILGGNSAFVGFTGGTGGTAAQQTISNFSFSSTPALSFANAVNVSPAATATVDVNTAAAAGVGPLAVGAGGTLNVTNTGAVANAPYTFSAASTTLAAGSALNMNANGAGVGTLATGGLAGVGTVTGVVRAGGTVAPGTAAGNTGTLSIVGALFTDAGATYAPETAAPGVSDVLALTGTLDLSAADTLNVLPLVAVGNTPSTYTIATFAALSGTFDTVLVNGELAQSANPAGANYVNVLYPTSPGGTAGQIQIQMANVAAVPEPATAGVLGLAAAGLLARRRRR